MAEFADMRDEGLRPDGTPQRVTSGPRAVVTSIKAGEVEAAPVRKASTRRPSKKAAQSASGGGRKAKAARTKK